MRAIWNGVTIAESDDTVVVEGTHYFPSGTADAQDHVAFWGGVEVRP